jgi:phenylalanyl-tRNA synthetase beta subunit
VGEGTRKTFQEGKGTALPVWQMPDNFVTIYSEGKELGNLGILDKSFTAKVCREGGQIVWFEIELDKITESGGIGSAFNPDIKFEETPRYPLSWQDFSLLWKIEDGFDNLESLLDRFMNPLVIRREFLVSYRGKGLDKEMACYSFRFWVGSPNHTLSSEEIESFHQQFLAYIKDNGIALRG